MTAPLTIPQQIARLTELMNAQEKRVVTLEERVKTLSTQQPNVTEFQAQVTEVKAELARIAQSADKVSSVDARVKTLERDVPPLSKAQDALKSRLDALADAVAKLPTTPGTTAPDLTEDVRALAERVASLFMRVDELGRAANVPNLTPELNELSARVDALATQAGPEVDLSGILASLAEVRAILGLEDAAPAAPVARTGQAEAAATALTATQEGQQATVEGGNTLEVSSEAPVTAQATTKRTRKATTDEAATSAAKDGE